MSMPSYAISMPASTSAACSADSSSRIGLVLLMWITIFRGQSRDSRVSTMPPAPDWFRCPMSWARLSLIPSLASSLSVHTVPSTSRQSASSM